MRISENAVGISIIYLPERKGWSKLWLLLERNTLSLWRMFTDCRVGYRTLVDSIVETRMDGQRKTWKWVQHPQKERCYEKCDAKWWMKHDTAIGQWRYALACLSHAFYNRSTVIIFPFGGWEISSPLASEADPGRCRTLQRFFTSVFRMPRATGKNKK